MKLMRRMVCCCEERHADARKGNTRTIGKHLFSSKCDTLPFGIFVGEEIIVHFCSMKYQIAIVDSNTLSTLALKAILQDLVPFAQVSTYSGGAQFLASDTSLVVHAFVSARIFVDYPRIREVLGRRIIVVGVSDTPASLYKGYHFLNAEESEMEIVKSFLKLRNMGHPTGEFADMKRPQVGLENNEPLLSKREEEVLALVVQGLTNKEIAERLFVSPSTVIFHRNNIALKLNTRSVAKFTIYAVNHGIVTLPDVIK